MKHRMKLFCWVFGHKAVWEGAVLALLLQEQSSLLKHTAQKGTHIQDIIYTLRKMVRGVVGSVIERDR